VNEAAGGGLAERKARRSSYAGSAEHAQGALHVRAIPGVRRPLLLDKGAR
jgi:hypothetical protein